MVCGKWCRWYVEEGTVNSAYRGRQVRREITKWMLDIYIHMYKYMYMHGDTNDGI